MFMAIIASTLCTCMAENNIIGMFPDNGATEVNIDTHLRLTMSDNGTLYSFYICLKIHITILKTTIMSAVVEKPAISMIEFSKIFPRNSAKSFKKVFPSQKPYF